jgi:hypothetical protein
MPKLEPVTPIRDLALLKRALERSGMTQRDFAREELVRDEKTLRAYLGGGPIPDVVIRKLEKLARRRPRPVA